MEVVSGVIANPSALLDDDGRPKRTGTVWTATAHIITAVIGAGVLSLAWAMAQLGWILGIASILVFAAVNLYTSNLLADCYRSPDSVTGKRNYTYMEAVKSHLGGKMHMLCGLVQYSNLAGFAIGYTITTSISLVTILKNDCLKKNGNEDSCHFSNNPSMIILGIVEIFLSQIPSFHKLAWLSILAAIMSFGYASIGIGLSLAKVLEGKGEATHLSVGSMGKSSAKTIWNLLVALGNLALASCYVQIAVDIQDTLKSTPPENKVMKMANNMAIVVMTIIFLMSGGFGYAAFGSDAAGSILMNRGVHPTWLVDVGNAFIIVHLIGAYQVIIQPFYHIVEILAGQRWPSSNFINGEHQVSIMGKMKFSINLFRLVWRSIFVVLVTVLAMALPFFNDMIGLLGALGFWPLVVYFPIEMTIVKHKIRKGTIRWFGLQSLSFVCMIVSLASATAAIHGLGQSLTTVRPFGYRT